MSRPATSRLKVNPPLGRMPVLQFVPPAELLIDDAYQRSLEVGASKSLIRKIAQFWNWDLCQPLVVSRRDSGELYVIDGQHRLEAAKLRGDIAQLPCVVVNYTCREDEAASFVHLNQQRRPLSKIDVFKAAVASGDEEALAITAAMKEAGLSVAPHTNPTAWKPGMVANISGLERAWRRRGSIATRLAMRVLGQAFENQVLRYGGTLFPGIAAVCSDECQRGVEDIRITRLTSMLARKSQAEWRKAVIQQRADDIGLGYTEAVEKVLREAWRATFGTTSSVDTRPLLAEVQPDNRNTAWCEQCDMRVPLDQAATCKSRFCSLKVRA